MGAERASGGRYKKSEASRQAVLDAAIQTIAKRGFVHTSVQDVADAAGMSKGVVHYHFDSKDDLVARVLELCAERLSARVRKAWDAAGTPSDKIRHALREMWLTRTDGSPEMRTLAELMAQGVHDPKLNRPLSTSFHAAREEMVQAFVSAFSAIGLRPKLPAHVIPRLLMATLDGIGLHRLFDPPTDAEDRELFRALEAIAFSMFEL